MGLWCAYAPTRYELFLTRIRASSISLTEIQSEPRNSTAQQMKTLTAIAVLALLSLTAQAQDTDQAQSRLKPLPPAIALDYEGKDFFSDKNSRLQKPEPRYRLFPKSSARVTEPASRRRHPMPVLAPDSTIRFSVRTKKPDPTTAFPMPVLKP